MAEDASGIIALHPGSRVVLVGTLNRETPIELATEYMDELEFLAQTAGAEASARLFQTLHKPYASTYIGPGKILELKDLMNEKEAGFALFDDELTPTQIRNIEKVLERNVLDRTALILQIFSQHARTAQAKTQVELARLEYELPRLRRMWTHLERQRGGTGTRGGGGELQIEADRRMIRNRIAKLKQDLKRIDQQGFTRRKSREQMVRVSLVGYTNVGKSTLMNLIAKADVLAENKLFATLDTTVRKVVLDQVPFLLADTVGFIRKLPTELVESFKSTLDEVREADLLLHVVDISSMNYLDQVRVVKQTLAELKAADKPTMMVFNKIDRLTEEDIAHLKQTWLNAEHYPCVFISAAAKVGIRELRATLRDQVERLYKDKYPGLNYAVYDTVGWDEQVSEG
jgi:GTP-binding protein HflX